MVTGAVMGTPSYMAPEQARDASRVDARADVYALGGILYACLTGRPLFLGADWQNTIRQVLEQDPVPPSRLNPQVPRDLETVCLKCLRKEAERRYSTARELAKDLGRYLRSEPIRARKVQEWERWWKWCRRNPAATVLAVAVVLLLMLGASVSLWIVVQTLGSLEEQKKAKEMQAQATMGSNAALEAREWAESHQRRLKKLVDQQSIKPQLKEALECFRNFDKEGAEKILFNCGGVLRLREWDYLFLTIKDHISKVNCVRASGKNKVHVSTTNLRQMRSQAN